MGGGEKICVLCGQSCAGQPRIKNEKGQYAHQACVKAKQEQQADAEPEYEDDYNDALGGGMDDLFDDDLLGDLGEQDEIIGSAMACPSCGQRMEEGAVVCMACGFNTQSGRSLATKRKEAKASGAGTAVLGGVAKVGGFAASPMLPLIGALIGGAIGAAIWAAIAYFFDYEFGWIAWIVGGLVGLGASIGPVDKAGGGAITGAMAAVVAMGAISAGKYAAVYFAVQSTFGSGAMAPLVIEDISEELIMQTMVDDVSREMIDRGESIAWEDPHLFNEAAIWPDEYPNQIQTMITNRWDSMSNDDRIAFRKGIAERSEFDLSYRDIDDDWALSSMAYIVTNTMIDDGEKIEWPDPNLPLNIAIWPEDYPADIQTKTRERWDSLSDDDQYVYRQNLLDKENANREIAGTLGQSITQQAFINSFKHPLNILFMFLAVITAYGIAANDE